ncbi:hypothetical protein GUJ93_ZPchr0010g8089 [Zizania palustris]|uniref:Proteasome assembly chaperone 3 n=1 Tax=Zizania palustris TaxID=103762 RepID=A0A8J5WHK7_ZIZPA|nr:hypothetical protein GUJ93_ZPchr0010g8089 [Zizania palustris]
MDVARAAPIAASPFARCCHPSNTIEAIAAKALACYRSPCLSLPLKPASAAATVEALMETQMNFAPLSAPFPVQHRKDESVFSDPTYNVSVLFGKRNEPLLLACARQLIEHISGSGSARSLMISLGLKDHSQGTVKDIVSTIIENCVW